MDGKAPEAMAMMWNAGGLKGVEREKEKLCKGSTHLGILAARDCMPTPVADCDKLQHSSPI